MPGTVDVIVRFLTDTSKVESDMGKVQGSGDKLKGWAKGVGAAIGGVFAVKTVSDWVGAAEEANAASAALSQTLGNAGDATGEWAKHAEDLANSLQYKTGIDDEVIKGGQTILATFHDLSGAAGQQSGAFDRATKAALDMSKAGFGSVDSASTMLGKALQEPEKGLTALGRAGVTFSEDQKAAIKAMVESGDKAGAMNAILSEVEGQVGGVAEKTATGADKMKVAWGETQESLGKALLPVLEALAPVLQNIAKFVQENATWLVPMVAGIIALNIALSLSPITLIAIAIAGLIAGLILLWQNWDTVWSAIQGAIGVAVGFILGLLQSVLDFFGSIISWLAGNWPLILAILTGPFGLAVMLIMNNWEAIKTFFGNIPGWIATALSGLVAIILWPYQQAWNLVTSLWSGITGFFAKIPGWIGGALASLGGIIVQPFQWAWDQIVRIKDSIVGAFQGAVDAVKGIWNGFARFWNGVEVEVGPWTMPGPIPDIPGFTLGLPDLPFLAKGGIVTRPTLAMLGEAGPEAVVPLDRAAGPVVVIQQATFSTEMDVDLFMQRVAWNLRTQAI